METAIAAFSGFLHGPGSLSISTSDWTLRTSVLILVALLLLGALILSVVARWRDRPGRLGPTPDEELSLFREMYERGELSREEFQRLKSVLGGKIRARMGKLSHPEVDPPSPGSPPPEGTGFTDRMPG